MVNITIDGIFNGVFEKQKSAQNEENFAKNSAIHTGDMRVYDVDVKHDSALREANGSLRQHVAERTPSRAGSFHDPSRRTLLFPCHHFQLP
jgi:hypothetical protein